MSTPWQTIDSCPRDGTRFVAKRGRTTAVVSWNSLAALLWGRALREHGFPHGLNWRMFFNWPRAIKAPTHWMPLDSTPAKQVGTPATETRLTE